MNPLIALAMGGSLAMQAFSAFQSSHIANEQAQISMRNAGLEIQQDQVRRQAMELSANRQNMEILRNAQRARSVALTNATSGGAQFGSGLQGGYGQIGGQTGFNLLGVSQNRQLGEQIFDLNAQIDQNKIQMAQLGGSLATTQAYGALGQDITKMAGPAMNLGQSIFGSSSPGQMNEGGGGKGGSSWYF